MRALSPVGITNFPNTLKQQRALQFDLGSPRFFFPSPLHLRVTAHGLGDEVLDHLLDDGLDLGLALGAEEAGHGLLGVLGEDVDLDEFIAQKDDLSGADIKAICSEAGLLALRERRMRVQMADFRAARERVLRTKQEGEPEGLYL